MVEGIVKAMIKEGEGMERLRCISSIEEEEWRGRKGKEREEKEKGDRRDDR